MDKDNRKIQNKANYLWTKVLTLQNSTNTEMYFHKGREIYTSQKIFDLVVNLTVLSTQTPGLIFLITGKIQLTLLK